MAEIRWTREAENWLRDIHDYIALDDPLTAIKVVGGYFIEEAIPEHVNSCGIVEMKA